MTSSDLTCWTLIGAAADGNAAAREEFARRYQPVAKAYFAARWQGSSIRSAIDDAIQDAFLECFKPGGVLAKANDTPPDGFRPFFHGLLRNIARRHEERRRPSEPLPSDLSADDTSLGQAFDRAWARGLLKEAARIQEERAENDPRRTRRVELLRLRFHQGLPIREIAATWGIDAPALHHEYAAARAEFREALRRVLAFHTPTATEAELEHGARELLRSLG